MDKTYYISLRYRARQACKQKPDILIKHVDAHSKVESGSTIRKHRLFTMSTNSVNGNDEGREEADVLEVEEDGGGLDVVNVSTEDAAFDEVVGCIEDIVVGTQFQAINPMSPHQAFS